MKKEQCIGHCKFLKDGICELYEAALQMQDFPDPYDKGRLLTYAKCDDCMEKELSCSIDEKVREIYSFYHAFREEMDILFLELDCLVDKRQEIYKEEK